MNSRNSLFRWSHLAPRFALAVLALGILVTPAACAKKPVIVVQYAQINGINLSGIVVGVVCRVHNSNGFDIQIRRLYADTMLAGSIRLPIDVQPNTWLPAKQTTSMVVPVTIPWFSIPQVLQATLGTEDIPYIVNGYADVTASQSLGIKVNKEPVTDQGVIKRSALLSAYSSRSPGAF